MANPNVTTLSAATREGTGKGVARALRREGRIPAVLYGAKKDPQAISINAHEFSKIYKKSGFFARLVELDLGKEKIQALPRALQLHPVNDLPEHVDFQRIDAKTPVHVMVRVNFVNREKSPGLKRGGTLNIVRREVELVCMPHVIPDLITIDLEGRNIGQSIHISHVPLPEGARPYITDRDFTIATIVGRRGQKEDEETAAEGEAAAA